MASVLDLRRRIRSVKSTRQITKAMKMVSAARLRRAQARAMAARPYAQMITAVLGSLIRRIEIIDPETGNLRHPLFAARPEKRVLLMVVSGDRGFAGAFNGNILKAGFQFLERNGGGRRFGQRFQQFIVALGCGAEAGPRRLPFRERSLLGEIGPGDLPAAIAFRRGLVGPPPLRRAVAPDGEAGHRQQQAGACQADASPPDGAASPAGPAGAHRPIR